MEEINFDLASFKKIKSALIATNEDAYSSKNPYYSNYWHRTREYTPEEIQNIISSGSLSEQQKLSRSYFNTDGYYKQIIMHYATLLKYAGILIPNPAQGKSLSTPHILKKYYGALEFIDSMSLNTFFTNCAQRALVDGVYYGIRASKKGEVFSVIDLPPAYCRSRFKNENGDDIIEFNLAYFDSILDETQLNEALAGYPKEISAAYRTWKKGKKQSCAWYYVPSNLGICFPLFDGRPLFLSVIPKIEQFADAVDAQRDRDIEEISKIIVQKIPHLQDGRLLFEPEEALTFHQAAVGMLKSNKHVNVLTTYADVDVVGANSMPENASSLLERSEQNIYAQAGVSSQLFASTNSAALTPSLTNDLSLMMYLAYKFARFVTNLINEFFSNSNINFKYTILPISYYNEDDYSENVFKLASSGYSFLIPAITLGISQKDLVNIKELENDVMKLPDKLIPLQTSYTQSYKSGGRPALADTDKASSTIETDASRDNAGGNT